MRPPALLSAIVIFSLFSTSQVFATDARMESFVVAVEQVYQSKGIVNTVDMKAGKLNLNMDAVPSLNWPPMTMDFNVSANKILEKIKPGQKVEFDFIEKSKSQYVITKITPAK